MAFLNKMRIQDGKAWTHQPILLRAKMSIATTVGIGVSAELVVEHVFQRTGEQGHRSGPHVDVDMTRQGGVATTRQGGIAPEKTAIPSSKCLNESCPGPRWSWWFFWQANQEVGRLPLDE